ncbi:hypothetical protein IA57_04060 [Mangrovimonas yunxiaonensis]|uniref:Uncharacterized protein n=1 Tax=Mangrovimonas yunxiaonensis TaxID=1197477 RepID=A0A084TMV8_9FLAO|nr:hypothetical protein IA57_04060 [Mangrovimonas yunxiaonensis]
MATMVLKNRGSDFEPLYADKKTDIKTQNCSDFKQGGFKTKLKELYSCSQAKRKQYAEKE